MKRTTKPHYSTTVTDADSYKQSWLLRRQDNDPVRGMRIRKSMEVERALSPSIRPQELETLLGSTDSEISDAAVLNDRMTEAMLTRIMLNGKSTQKRNVLKNRNVKKQHIKIGLRDTSSILLMADCAAHRLITNKLLSEAQSSQFPIVRKAAAANPTGSKWHRARAAADSNTTVRIALLSNSRITRPEVETVIRDLADNMEIVMGHIQENFPRGHKVTKSDAVIAIERSIYENPNCATQRYAIGLVNRIIKREEAT